MIYRNRSEAGKQLAARLAKYADRDDVLVLALPRGGVPVGFEVAKQLHVSLDIFLVRKLGLPGHEELAMGAISTGGVRVLNDDIVDYLQIPGEVIDAVAADELKELERREREYRGNRPEPDVQGKTVILIDDGLATGSTMRAAAAALRQKNPARIIVAVPVSASQSRHVAMLSAEARRRPSGEKATEYTWAAWLRAGAPPACGTSLPCSVRTLSPVLVSQIRTV